MIKTRLINIYPEQNLEYLYFLLHYILCIKSVLSCTQKLRNTTKFGLEIMQSRKYVRFLFIAVLRMTCSKVCSQCKVECAKQNICDDDSRM